MLVVGAKEIGMSRITQAARQLRLPEEKLLGDWIVTIPGFTLKNYRQLQRSRLSIFSRHCFGGLISNALGLPFRSPFINLSLSEEDFIRFMRHSRLYMEEDLIFKEKLWNDWEHEGFYYPVFTLGNVSLKMHHYRDFDEAVKKWNERKQKINWYNLLVISFTEDEKILAEFNALPYGKKVCFVSFKSDSDSAWYINPKKALQFNPHIKEDKGTWNKGFLLWNIVNYSAIDMKFYYDPFDMLLYGKKTPLIDM